MNSYRYSPDDFTTEHVEEDAAPQQLAAKTRSPKETPSKVTKAKVTKAKVTKAGKKKRSAAGKTGSRGVRTDMGTDTDKTAGKKVADASTEKRVTKKAGDKKPVRKTAINRVGKTAMSKEAAMRAMAKQDLVPSNTEPAASSGMNGELGSRQEMAHDGGDDANRDEMENTDTVADIFIIDRVASDASNADLINGFEAASDTIRVSSNLALGDHIADNSNIVGWKTEEAADGTQTVTIYAGDAVNDTKILAVIRNVTGQFGEENLYDASALITFKHLMNMQDGGAAGQQSLNGLDTVAEIFQIDSQVSTRDQADVIVNFTDGQDMIRIKAIDTAIADNGNQVSWKSVADASDASKQDITIYAGATENAATVLAVIEDFDGTFDANNFEALTGVTFAEIQ